MAKLFYWNIKNFTDKRVNHRKSKPVHDDDRYGTVPKGSAVVGVIMDTFLSTFDNNGNSIQPDFVIVVEVCGTSGNPNEGDVAAGDGLQGCLTLLTILRNCVPGRQAWMLVPPIVTGQGGRREAVAVYYRSDRWRFLGPETRGLGYGHGIGELLPDDVIPPGYPYRGGQQTIYGAGQYTFPMHGGGGTVNFPTPAHRKPWLTAFGDVTNPNNLLRIFAVHTTPADAHVATENIAMTAAIQAGPDATSQVDVVVGDFNVDNTNPATFAVNGPFWDLLNFGYGALIRPPNGMAAQYNSYYHTIGAPAWKDERGMAAIMDDSRAQPSWLGSYPGQAYTTLSVDNVLVRYRGTAAPINNPGTTILSRARSLPHDAPDPAPGYAVLRGSYLVWPFMETPIEVLWNERVANPQWRYEVDMNQRFRSWFNYGRLYAVSDHFPIVFDV